MWKPSKLGLSISFPLWGFSSLLTLYAAPGMFTNFSLVLLLLFADLSVPIFHFQLKKKKTREKSRRKSDIVQLSRWRDSFSSALCSILSKNTLFQPMTACVISELYYKIMQKQSVGIKCKNNLLKPCKWHCAFGQNNRVQSKLCLS